MNPFLVFSGVAALAAGASARWNWWRPVLPGVPILMYHKVGDPPAGSKLRKLWVSAATFRRQLAYLADHGYRPIVFKDLYQHWDSGVPLPPKPVLITFDDGYLNNHDIAFPILRDFGFRATIFVVVTTVGGDNAWHNPATETRIPMVSWAQLRDLRKAGWEIGSHTMTHANLLKIDLDAVAREVTESRDAIAKELGETPLTFAYPYGAGADEAPIRATVAEAGYRLAVSVHTGKWPLERLRAEPHVLPRVFVRGDDTLYDFHLQLTRGRSRL